MGFDGSAANAHLSHKCIFMFDGSDTYQFDSTRDATSLEGEGIRN
jgi:hypothetical protein